MITQMNEMIIAIAEESNPNIFVILLVSPPIPIKIQEVIFQQHHCINGLRNISSIHPATVGPISSHQRRVDRRTSERGKEIVAILILYVGQIKRIPNFATVCSQRISCLSEFFK